MLAGVLKGHATSYTSANSGSINDMRPSLPKEFGNMCNAAWRPNPGRVRDRGFDTEEMTDRPCWRRNLDKATPLARHSCCSAQVCSALSLSSGDGSAPPGTSNVGAAKGSPSSKGFENV